MALKKEILLTYKEYDTLLECIRYRVADCQKQRQEAEAKGWDLAVKTYNEDIEKFHALRDNIIDQYNK
ncbi:MAG: hypothetical protein IJP93_04340 [Bacteroidales bacterium]|nr:hypothetical protein [Bacteroidales bacterium]MBR0083292.1 hypothetical protein [Bacteroidales bacterium]